MKTVNVKDFAVYIGASEQVVRAWCRSKRLPGVQKVDGVWEIDDPKTAAAAWRAQADHSKTSEKVLEKALTAGRADAGWAPTATIDPELAKACESQAARHLRWLHGAARVALPADQAPELDHVFELYVAAYCPTQLAAWRAGEVQPDQHAFD
ncbi:MAG: hypothetical protein QM723_40595 [Myxococcaceae bacterium]